MIKKQDGKYTLYSKAGDRKLGEAKSLKDIQKRERQVQYFKHLKEKLKKK